MKNESTNTPAAAPQSSGSTGSRTAAGKAVSSQNARKHDLCSRTLRLSPDEWEEYNDMSARYRRDLQPADDVEHTLIDEILFNYWRLQQAREAELQIIDEHPTELPIIALYIRYRTGYERGYYKALDKLQATQRIRKQQASNPGQACSGKARSGKARSEKAAPAPVSDAPLNASLPALVRSVETRSAVAELQEEIQNYLLEKGFRSEVGLPPLAFPKNLSQKLSQFVSKNPGVLSAELLAEWKKAA